MPKISKNKSLSNKSLNLIRRPRRLRQTPTIREAIAETDLKPAHLVKPVFIQEGLKKKYEIKAMPGQYRYSLNELLREVEFSLKSGIGSFALFPIIETAKKNARGTNAFERQNLVALALEKVKKEFPETILYADIALDPYTDHGHDGFLQNGEILNDATVELLVKQSLLMAETGADFVSPSDMMDGRVGEIRRALDEKGFTNTGIMSYTAKYASGFYGPFREALSSGLKSGDKKTYQMDYRNKREALLEAELDFAEGADIMMVKPALAYLDIIHVLKENFPVPIAAYQVSGEYSMIKLAAQAGVINEDRAILESLYSIRRAGADLIFTYFADDLVRLLQS